MAFLGAFLIFLLGAVTVSESATGYTLLGGSCLKNDECTIPNASCQNEVCECNPNFLRRPNNEGCYPVVRIYQGACEESIQCVIPGIPDEKLSCVNGQCVCHQPYTYRSGSCLGNAQLGEPCRDEWECATLNNDDIQVVWCYNDRCNCRKGYKEENHRCVIGGNCENDLDCTGDKSGLSNSFCDKRVRQLPHCACKEGFTPALNNTACLQEVSRLGEGCMDDSQCNILGAAECTNGHCVCRRDAKEEKGKCNGASALASISALLLLLFVPTRFII